MSRPKFRLLIFGLLPTFFPTESYAADDLAHEIITLKRKLVVAAKRSQDHEDRVTRIETRLMELSRRAADLGSALYERRTVRTATLSGPHTTQATAAASADRDAGNHRRRHSRESAAGNHRISAERWGPASRRGSQRFGDASSSDRRPAHGTRRGYGKLLIIDHGEGYHTLLAGFSRIESIQGQWLLAGEPVGVMGRGLTDHKSLYVEFRRDGVAIDPLPWLAAAKKKATG